MAENGHRTKQIQPFPFSARFKHTNMTMFIFVPLLPFTLLPHEHVRRLGFVGTKTRAWPRAIPRAPSRMAPTTAGQRTPPIVTLCLAGRLYAEVEGCIARDSDAVCQVYDYTAWAIKNSTFQSDMGNINLEPYGISRSDRTDKINICRHVKYRKSFLPKQWRTVINAGPNLASLICHNVHLIF